ncbi:MAG TPA: hypothetical protein VK166_13615 [Chitinophagaceae bacterium]|nr:hypothetical protein [Chitinophagaceae bacterium]
MRRKLFLGCWIIFMLLTPLQLSAAGRMIADAGVIITRQDSIQTSPADARHLIIGNKSPWLRSITYKGHSFALVNALITFIFFCFIIMIPSRGYRGASGTAAFAYKRFY